MRVKGTDLLQMAPGQEYMQEGETTQRKPESGSGSGNSLSEELT